MNDAQYQKGYAAGRKSAVRSAQEAERRAFLDAAYLAMLPVAFGPDFRWGTTARNGVHVPYKTIEERVAFVKQVALDAWEQRP